MVTGLEVAFIILLGVAGWLAVEWVTTLAAKRETERERNEALLECHTARTELAVAVASRNSWAAHAGEARGDAETARRELEAEKDRTGELRARRAELLAALAERDDALRAITEAVDKARPVTLGATP